MILKITDYDRRDLINYLDIAAKSIKSKKVKKGKWNDITYDLNRIKYLQDIIIGNIATNNYDIQCKEFRKKPSKRYYIPQDELIDLGFDNEV